MRRNNRGSIILLTLLAVSISGLLATVSLERTIHDYRLAQISVANEQAFQAAEAGVIDAIVRLRVDWDQCGAGTVPGSLPAQAITSYTITCDAWYQRTITSTGQSHGRVRSIERIYIFDPTGAPVFYRLVLWREN